jgi:hypothetical protein
MLLVIFRIGGTAIDASEVTAVSNRNSQVGDLPAEFVLQCHAAKSPEKEKARFSLAQGLQVQLVFKPCNPEIGIGRTPGKNIPALRSFPT